MTMLFLGYLYIFVNITGNKKKKTRKLRTETSMLSPVSTCDISGFSEENVWNVMNERQIKKNKQKN